MEEFTIKRKKLGSYSDDAQLCTTTEEGVLEYYKIMTEYSRMSSQGINWGKTTISSLNGYTQAFKSWLLEVDFKEENIKERNEKGTVLGNTIDLQNKSERHQLEEKNKKIQNKINRFNTNVIGIRGRIIIADAIMTSQLTYVTKNMNLKERDFKNIQKL